MQGPAYSGRDKKMLDLFPLLLERTDKWVYASHGIFSSAILQPLKKQKVKKILRLFLLFSYVKNSDEVNIPKCVPLSCRATDSL